MFKPPKNPPNSPNLSNQSLDQLNLELAKLNLQIEQHHAAPTNGIVPPHLRARILGTCQTRKETLEAEIAARAEPNINFSVQ